MKILFSLIILIFSCFACKNKTSRESVIQTDIKSLEVDSTSDLKDSADWTRFHNACLNNKAVDKFLNTYRFHASKGTKLISKSDLPLFLIFIKDTNSIKNEKNKFFLFNTIAKINIGLHLDLIQAEDFLNKAYNVAKKQNDTCILIEAYRTISGFQVDNKHDLVKGHFYLKKIEQLEAVFKDENHCNDWSNTDISFSVLYYYLEDYKTCIHYLNKGIRYEQTHENDLQNVFDLYKRRSFFEMELGEFKSAHSTIDSAQIFAELAENNGILLQKGLARKAAIYCKEKKYDLAAPLIAKVDLSNLQSSEYYIYLEELANFELHNRNYLAVKSIITLFEKDLKPWNDQRWMSANLIRYKYAKSIGDTQMALQAYERYKMRYDLVHGEKRRNALMANEIRYQTQKKEQNLKLKSSELNTVKEKSKSFFILAISIGLLLLLIFTVYAFYKLKEKQKMQQSFSQQLIRSTEQERNRIAKDLHDGLSQQLLIVKNSLSLTGQTENSEKVASSIESLRQISRDLYPTVLESVGLENAILSLLEQIDAEYDLFISHSIEYSDKRLNKEEELQIYRIVQEAINNVLKYANAEALKVELIEKGHYLEMTIQDNGKGFNVKEKLNSKNTFGLHSIKERANSLRAKMSILSNEKTGTKIQFQIPIQ